MSSEITQESAALLLFSNPVQLRNGDVEQPYRQHSDFYYLTGLEEPEAAALFLPGEPGYVLFVRPRNKERETWEGRRIGVDGAREEMGADLAHSIEELDAKLLDYLGDTTALCYLMAEQQQWDRRVLDCVRALANKRRKKSPPLAHLYDARALIHSSRLTKSTFELEKMQEVCELTAGAHLEAMRRCQPGMTEWQLQDVVENQFRAGASRRVAYDSIVGSGDNATILHYRENTREMRAGDLVLIDAGAEKSYYSADITRTFPVAGRFRDIQARIYQTVLDAQLAAIERAQVGATLDDVHEAAFDVIRAWLDKQGLLGDVADAEARDKRVKQFFMHRTSHFLGMDVHDVGSYYQDGAPRRLQPHMVITIEPGLYFASDDTSVPEEYRGVGVRIEDDIVIEPPGPRILTKAAPKTIAEIESACAS